MSDTNRRTVEGTSPAAIVLYILSAMLFVLAIFAPTMHRPSAHSSIDPNGTSGLSSVAFQDPQDNSLAGLQKAVDGDRRCDGAVDGTTLARQTEFISDHRNQSVRKGNMWYYHIPGTGVTLSYNLDRCTFGVKVETWFTSSDGSLRQMSIDDQVVFAAQSSGSILAGSKLGTSCYGTRPPRLPSKQGQDIPYAYVFCQR